MTVTVNGQNIYTSDEELIVSESVDIYECEFEFDSTWDGWDKTAKFEGSGVTKEMILIDDKTSIPDEVIKEDGWMRVGVYGTRNAQVMPTIWGADVYVRHGTEHESTEITPTPSIYAQILNLANGAKDTADDAKAAADDVSDDWAAVTATATTLEAGSPATATFANNNFAFGIPKGDTGATGAKGDKGDKGDTGATGAKGDKGDKGDNGDVTNIADAYSTSATYAVGDYCIYNSQLYRCTTAITTAEAWTASHWTAVAMGDEVGDLRSAVDAVVDFEEVWSDFVPQANITRLNGKKIISSTHNLDDSASWSVLYWQADEDGLYDIVVSKSQAQTIGAIYSSENFSSTTYVKNITKLTYTHFQVEVSAGQYIAISAWYTDYTIDIKHYEGKTYTIPSIAEEIKSEEDNLFNNGWMHLPAENFSRNEWSGYNSTTSRTHRVKYDLPLQFGWDITLLASAGFYISGYKSDGTAFTTGTTINVPANTLFKIYVRRINEDSSELADVEEFANALNISTPLAGMEKYKHTFTDITMFPRIGISGDSYSAGGGVISGITALTWGKNLERESGVTVDIYAKSGESIVQWNTDATNGLPALLAGEECGLYWFAHGINGTSTEAALGTPADMSENPKPQTFYGQYVYAIETVKRMFPKARIVLATIMGTGYSLYQTTYTKVNTAIRNIATYCNVPVVDLASDDFYKSIWYDSHHLSNHPTAMLNAGIAHANRRILANVIMDKASYFIDYGDKYNYAISCPVVTGGYVSASPSIAESGATVTLSNTAYTGYHFVRYESNDVTITDGSFTMPSNKVTITGVFEAD